MLHSYSSTALEPSRSVDRRIHHPGYWDYENRRRSSPTSPSTILNDPPAGLQSSQRTPRAVEYPRLEHLLCARELRRQQARDHKVPNQQQSARHFQTQEEQDLAKALEDSFITETAHRLFLKNKQREEDRAHEAQEELLREQHRREADRAWERYYIEQYHQQEKEKTERRQRRKDRKAQQQQQQQHVSFATPTSSLTTSSPAPLTYSTITSSSNTAEEISNPENKQLQRLEKRFQLRRPSPDNDNPNNTGREVYHNPFMQPTSGAYFYSPHPASPTASSPTISLSTPLPQSPVSSTSYSKHDFDRERESRQLEKEREKAKDKVKEWMGGRERARYKSSSRFRKETRRSRSCSRGGRFGEDYHKTVWEREEREMRVAAGDWVYGDREGF